MLVVSGGGGGGDALCTPDPCIGNIWPCDSFKFKGYSDISTIYRVSEWLLFNTKSAGLKLYHNKNKLLFNKVMMTTVFYKINKLSWIFILLAHWNNSPLIDISPHSDTILILSHPVFVLSP
jgi:hypothetical protein